MANNITITKAKIKDSLFPTVDYSEQVKDGTNDVSKSCTAPIHDDMRLAFRALNVHLALLCEQVIENKKAKAAVVLFSGEDIEDEEPETFKLDDANREIALTIRCTGFTIGNNLDGVTLVGRRELATGKTLNLVSPYMKWDDDYQHAENVQQIIERCQYEVYEYLFNDKHQPDTQLSLEFKEADEQY